MIERTLGGRYKLLERIGSGGMAEVFKADDILLDRTVAVKILHPAYKNDVEFIEKFHREAKAAACMSHPNIVNIFDVGEDAGEHYIVMEYVPGDNLKNKIQQEAPMDIALSVLIAKDIAQGLAHAHYNNIVHCDIKPHNILMTEDNHAKIADFGIARAVTESTMTYSGSVVGSVRYFSPEQAKGAGITPKSDVYSVGVVLYEMLTGRLPFNADNPVSIAMKHVDEEAVPPAAYRPQISPMIESIVMRSMSKNPDLRPTSSELVQELSDVLKTLGISKEVDPDATQVLPKTQNNVIQRPIKVNTNNQSNETVPANDSIKQTFFKSKIFVAGLVVVLIIGFGIGSILSFGNFFSKQEEVPVPDVVGKQLALARQILEDGKLRVNVAETYDASVPPGQVVSQEPESGKTVKSERLITIYVSKGGEDLDMPDLVGLSKSAATEKLQKAGLVLGSIYEKYADEEPGTVLSHDPAANTKISRGQTIDLTVSRGEAVHYEPRSYSSKESEKTQESSNNNDSQNTTTSNETSATNNNSESNSHSDITEPSESQDNNNYDDSSEVFNSTSEENNYSSSAPSPDDSALKQR